MGEDAQTEGPEGHGWQLLVQWTDKILVKPLCLFNLEANALDRSKILLGEVDDEANTEVVQP